MCLWTCLTLSSFQSPNFPSPLFFFDMDWLCGGFLWIITMHTVICRKISSADLVVIPTLLYRYSIYESLSSPNHYLYYWLGYYDVRFSDNYPCSSRRKCRRWHLMLATFYNYLKAIDRNKWMQYSINLEFFTSYHWPVLCGKYIYLSDTRRWFSFLSKWLATGLDMLLWSDHSRTRWIITARVDWMTRCLGVKEMVIWVINLPAVQKPWQRRTYHNVVIRWMLRM